MDDFSRASPNVVVYDASYDSYIQLRDVVTQIAKLLQGVLLQEDCSAAQLLFDPFRFPFADFAQFCTILWGFSPVQKFNISTFRRVRRPASSCVVLRRPASSCVVLRRPASRLSFQSGGQSWIVVSVS